MNKFIHYIIVATFFSLFCTISINIQSQTSVSCNNADFEYGDFTNWTGYTGSNPGYNPVITGTGIVSGRHTIMSGNGIDSNTINSGTGIGIPVVNPNGGLYSCRLGNSLTGAQADRLEYSYNVTQANCFFYYSFAVVLQDPGHSASQQPRFEMNIINPLTGQQIGGQCGQYLVVAGANIPGFYTSSTGIRCKPWTTVGVDLSYYIGMTVTIRFTTADCGQGTHYGYAYIEAGCFPAFNQIPSCSGSTNYTITAPPGFLYSWTGPGITTPVTTQTFNISNYTPGSTYYCTLTHINGCSTTYSIVAMLSPVTSNFSYNNNGTTTTFNDLSTVTGGYTIVSRYWDFGDGNTSTLQNPNHTYCIPTTYNVSLITTSSNGCTDTSSQTITVGNPLLINLNYCPNSTNATIIAPSGYSYQWTGTGTTAADTNQTLNITNVVVNSIYQCTLTSSSGCTGILSTTLVPSNVTSIFSYTNFGSCFTFHDLSTVTVTDTIVSWYWDFGDSTTSTLQNPAHSFTTQGTHTVTLIITTSDGCYSTNTIGVTGSSNLSLTSLYCSGATTATATAPSGYTYSWTGPGITTPVTTQTLNITNAVANSVYTCVLTLSPGCTLSLTTTLTPYAVNANYSYANNGTHYSFIDFSSVTGGGYIVSWFWDFGDGATSTLQYPNHTFPSSGSYTVILTVTESNGCTDSYIITIQTPLNINNDNLSDFSTDVYPNPFDKIIYIDYKLNKKAKIKVEIIDMLGRNVETIVNTTQNIGKYYYKFNATQVKSSSNQYQIKFTVNGKVYIKNVVGIK